MLSLGEDGDCGFTGIGGAPPKIQCDTGLLCYGGKCQKNTTVIEQNT